MDRDKYLQKRYGITLARYEEELARHNGTCAICGYPPVTRSLAVDHDHNIPYLKITTEKAPSGEWSAFTFSPTIVSLSSKKNTAIRNVRNALRTASVRGIICHQCNRGLRMFKNSPEILEKAANYLKSYQSRINGQ